MSSQEGDIPQEKKVFHLSYMFCHVASSDNNCHRHGYVEREEMEEKVFRYRISYLRTLRVVLVLSNVTY